jgi:hypothetical protein
MDSNDACSLGPVAGDPTIGLCPAGAAPELQNFFSSYSTLCDWAGTGVATADTLNFNNNGITKVGLPPMSYGFPSPDMIDDHPFSFLLHGSATDPWSNGLSAQELLAARPGPAFGFEGAWAGPGLVATAAPYA